jgi:hypothetical protein
MSVPLAVSVWWQLTARHPDKRGASCATRPEPDLQLRLQGKALEVARAMPQVSMNSGCGTSFNAIGLLARIAS